MKSLSQIRLNLLRRRPVVSPNRSELWRRNLKKERKQVSKNSQNFRINQKIHWSRWNSSMSSRMKETNRSWRQRKLRALRRLIESTRTMRTDFERSRIITRRRLRCYKMILGIRRFTSMELSSSLINRWTWRIRRLNRWRLIWLISSLSWMTFREEHLRHSTVRGWTSRMKERLSLKSVMTWWSSWRQRKGKLLH